MRDKLQQNKGKTKDSYEQQNNHQYPLLQQIHDEEIELWEPRMVTQTTAEPRLYMVESADADGSLHHMNRQFLRPAKTNLIKTLLSSRHNYPPALDTNTPPANIQLYINNHTIMSVTTAQDPLTHAELTGYTQSHVISDGP